MDDLGWRDAGYAGSDFYETPHIDRLASEGMVFTNAYSAAANCAPARASLLTGQYTPRHRIFNVGTGPRGEAAYRRLLHVSGTDTLDPALSQSHAAKARELAQALADWRRETRAPVPAEPNPAFDAEAERRAIAESASPTSGG